MAVRFGCAVPNEWGPENPQAVIGKPDQLPETLESYARTGVSELVL